jgi:hypothetical protein
MRDATCGWRRRLNRIPRRNAARATEAEPQGPMADAEACGGTAATLVSRDPPEAPHV